MLSHSTKKETTLARRITMTECDCLINETVPADFFAQLQERLESYFKSHQGIPDAFDDDKVLAATVESLHIDQPHKHTDDEDIKVHLFQYAKPEKRKMDVDAGSFYTLQHYPNEQQSELWNSLHFDGNLKERLYSYIAAIFKFAAHGLTCSTRISFNRMILLHGPPGTGKSTLAKALVSRLSTRIWSMTGVYYRIACFTVHSNQLFSRWFSESGKAIQMLFESIERTALEEKGTVVAVIIDEIESLAMNRQRSIDSNEPTDSIRAVNTLLTQIDRLRCLPNIFFLTTSNFYDLIDSAFLDRIDWSIQLPFPSQRVIYHLLYDTFEELEATGLLISEASDLISFEAAELLSGHPILSLSAILKEKSGRWLKKLPLLAFAALLEQDHEGRGCFSLAQYVDEIIKIVEN